MVWHLRDQLLSRLAAIAYDYTKCLEPFLAEAQVATVHTTPDTRRLCHFTTSMLLPTQPASRGNRLLQSLKVGR